MLLRKFGVNWWWGCGVISKTGFWEGSYLFKHLLLGSKKPNPRFLDENNVGCLVCEVEEGVHNICRFYCIVLDKANSLVGAV